MTEEWRDIPGYENFYQISNRGNLLRKDSGRLLAGWVARNGYPTFALCVNGMTKTKTAHSLVALAFLGPKLPGFEVRHLDGNKLNSDLDNLVYGTRSENMRDEVTLGRNHQSLKTICPSGHPYSGKNLRISPSKNGGVQRICRECVRIQSSITFRQKRDAKLNPQEKAVIEELRREREAAMIAAGRNT